MDALQDGRVSLTRRGFLLGAVSSLWLLSGHACQAAGTARRSVSPPQAAVQDHLVIHPVSGRIHHSRLCSGHLPRQAVRLHDLHRIDPSQAHRTRHFNVFEVMARQCLETEDLQGAMLYLQQAIVATPERVHLYDRLARLYGRQKQYAQIAGMFEDGIRRIRAELLQRPDQRRWNKALRDLQARSDRIKQRYPTA